MSKRLVNYAELIPRWTDYSLKEINDMFKEAAQNTKLETNVFYVYGVQNSGYVGSSDKIEIIDVYISNSLDIYGKLTWRKTVEDGYTYISLSRDLKNNESLRVIYIDKETEFLKDTKTDQYIEEKYIDYVIKKILAGFPDQDIAKKIK